MDSQSLEVLKDVAVEVAKDAYKDTAQPVLKPTGQTLGLLPRAIKAALLPLEKWIVCRENNLAEIEKLLEIKLQNVSPDQIAPPEAYIGVPALQYISYCMDSEELRDMYANLLAKSMCNVTRSGVHPSYVEIIKQLCPDEAKILRVIDGSIPVITLRFQNSSGEGFDIFKNFSDIGDTAKCDNPENVGSYIDNLERLGLISTEYGSYLVDKAKYESLKKHPIYNKTVKELAPFYSENYHHQKNKEGFYSITHFGQLFSAVCVKPLANQEALK